MKLNDKFKNFIIFFIVVLLGVLLGIGFIYLIKKQSNYYAVFLNNGAIYFGKLSTFPRLRLDNAIFIQADQNGQRSIQEFKDAFWMPKGTIYLNRDSILFIAPLDKKSPLISLIEQKQIPIVTPQYPVQTQSLSQTSSQIQSQHQIKQESQKSTTTQQ